MGCPGCGCSVKIVPHDFVVVDVHRKREEGLEEGSVQKISDTQRYKCLGNAVTTNVISAIIYNMYKELFG